MRMGREGMDMQVKCVIGVINRLGVPKSTVRFLLWQVKLVWPKSSEVGRFGVGEY